MKGTYTRNVGRKRKKNYCTKNLLIYAIYIINKYFEVLVNFLKYSRKWKGPRTFLYIRNLLSFTSTSYWCEEIYSNTLTCQFLTHIILFISLSRANWVGRHLINIKTYFKLLTRDEAAKFFPRNRIRLETKYGSGSDISSK